MSGPSSVSWSGKATCPARRSKDARACHEGSLFAANGRWFSGKDGGSRRDRSGRHCLIESLKDELKKAK